MSIPLLRLSAVRKTFGPVQALKGVSFDLHAGEVHALVGENGAGKSTLIRIITGAQTPDAGAMELDGRRLEHLTPAFSRKLGIACVYQQPALFPDLTVAENIALRLETGPPLRRVDWANRSAQARHWLQQIGAHVRPEVEVRHLSMPDQQLVEIACALGAGTRIILLDEPTASLTQKEQHLLFEVVRGLRRRGAGIIYISHRLEEVFALADRVTVLRDGETVTTQRAGDLNEERLISLMVGREITQLYPARKSIPTEVVCSLRGIGCSSSGVRDITLEIRKGEVLGVAGLVGAGRTELARVLFGITPADSGEMRLDGKAVSIRSPQEAVARGIAYVPEDRRRQGVILELPIEQNMTMAIHRRIFPYGWLRPKAERQIASEFIKTLDIKTQGPAAPAYSLSGGNQQKVAIARWLAVKPKLLILDEPTQGVDVGAKSEIHRLIAELASQGLAVLLISSDLPEVLGMSDRIAVMRNGSVVAFFPRTNDAQEVMAAAFGQRSPEK